MVWCFYLKGQVVWLAPGVDEGFDCGSLYLLEAVLPGFKGQPSKSECHNPTSLTSGSTEMAGRLHFATNQLLLAIAIPTWQAIHLLKRLVPSN
jgi:hypothetical protein